MRIQANISMKLPFFSLFLIRKRKFYAKLALIESNKEGKENDLN